MTRPKIFIVQSNNLQPGLNLRAEDNNPETIHRRLIDELTDGKSWTFDQERGELKTDQGEVLAIFPHSIASDRYDIARGRVMARLPELLRVLADVYSVVVWDSESDGPKWVLDRATALKVDALLMAIKADLQ